MGPFWELQVFSRGRHVHMWECAFSHSKAHSKNASHSDYSVQA